MATRFYFNESTAASVNPSFDVGWEQTGQANRVKLVLKGLVTISQANNVTGLTLPITTTQDVLGRQFVSDPIWVPQNIQSTVEFIGGGTVSASTANATNAIVVKVVSNDGSIVRGTLYSSFSFGGVMGTSALAASRDTGLQTVTSLTTQSGDRIVVELGVHLAAPTAATTGILNYSDNQATDLTALNQNTTTNNPWIEFSQDLFKSPLNNYQFVKAPDGISVTEKIR